MMRFFLFFLAVLGSCAQLFGQDTRNLIVVPQDNGMLLADFLHNVEQKQSVDFLYREGLLNNIMVGGVREPTYFNYYLDKLFSTFQLKLIDIGSGLYCIVKDDTRYEFGRRKSNYLVFKEVEGNRQKVKGTLYDFSTNEPLIGAQVVISETGAGALTDGNGYFQITIPKGVYQLDVRYIGYETGSYIIGFSPKSLKTTFKGGVFPSTTELKSVTISAERQDNNVRAVVPGIEKLGIEAIKQLPTFLGEVDPVKSLTSLPGVSTVGELSAGFNVRGGESGQNLILQDGAILYNPTHLFGFFSAFHPDMVSDVALYKGGGPARFGGRVSSVLEVALRNGATRRQQVKGGAGIISSRLSVEGPLLKDKLTYLIGGRIAYPNWLIRATDNIQLSKSSARFHDITGKLFFKLNQTDFLTLSGYRSYDDFKFAADSTFGWETHNATLRWDHTYKDNFYSTLIFSTSNYQSQVENHNVIEAFLYKNSIHTFRLADSYFHTINDRFKLNYGIELAQTDISPGALTPTHQTSIIKAQALQKQHSLEGAAYFQADFQVSASLSLAAGVRQSNFFRFGPDLLYSFNFSKLEGRYPEITDSLRYKKRERIISYSGWAPRVSARFLLTNHTSLKAAYFRTYQYIHLISNTASVTPQDYYVASGPYLQPEVGDQFSIGVFRNLEDNL